MVISLYNLCEAWGEPAQRSSHCHAFLRPRCWSVSMSACASSGSGSRMWLPGLPSTCRVRSDGCGRGLGVLGGVHGPVGLGEHLLIARGLLIDHGHANAA